MKKNFKVTNLKRLFVSDAGFLLVKVKEFKNGRIEGLEVSDSGGVEEITWDVNDKDVRQISSIRG